MSRCCVGDKWPKNPLRLVASWCERWPLAGMANDSLKESRFHNQKHCELMRSSVPINLARKPTLGCTEMGGKSSGAPRCGSAMFSMSQKVLRLT